ncbi:MAG: iron-containing alcohol dehydrogenase [Acidimicrobiales bacterium]
MHFELSTPTWNHRTYFQTVLFGPETIGELPRIVEEIPHSSVLLVASRSALSSRFGEILCGLLADQRLSVFDAVQQHSPEAAVQSATQIVSRMQAPAVISFGGGSAIDTAKAVVAGLDPNAPAHIAIPTTYSGAEMTGFFGVKDESSRSKIGGGHPETVAQTVIYDPLATIAVPLALSVATAINALAHGVEALFSDLRTPEVELLSREVITIMSADLPLLEIEPHSVDVRTRLMLGAYFAGRVLQNARTGLHHVISQIIGSYAGIPHGVANAVMLPHTFEAQKPYFASQARVVEELLASSGDGFDLRRLSRLGQVHAGLRASGVDRRDLAEIALRTVQNPKVRELSWATSTFVKRILEAAYEDS